MMVLLLKNNLNWITISHSNAVFILFFFRKSRRGKNSNIFHALQLKGMNDSYLTFSTNCDKLLVYVFPLQQFPLSLSPFALLSNATLASGMTSIDYAWENMQNAECIYDAHLWTMTITTKAICNGYDSDTYMHAYIHTYVCNAMQCNSDVYNWIWISFLDRIIILQRKYALQSKQAAWMAGRHIE